MNKIIFVILAGILLFTSFGCKRPGAYQIAGEDSVNLYGENTVGQTFVSDADNLFTIKVMAYTGFYKNGYLPNQKDIIFHLKKDPQDKDDIASLKFNTINVPDGDYLSLQFPPVKDSKDKKYYFYLESKEATPGASIRLGLSNTDLYFPGSAYISNIPQKGDLKFKVFYYGNIPQTIIGYFADFFNRLIKDPAFFLGYFLIIFTISITILVIQQRSRDENQLQ